MIRLSFVEIRGMSDRGPFGRRMTFKPGLQVISGNNTYGKSLTATAIAWCLGFEPIFGAQDDDPSRFPIAIREELELDGISAHVQTSSASLGIENLDGRKLRLTRAIRGTDLKTILVEETAIDGSVRTTRLMARQKTMKDSTGGFQNFLFEWLGWPRQPVVAFQGESELFLENLAPLFFIDQNEGWSTPQALQIRRYGQQQIGDIALDYSLGDVEAVAARVRRLSAAQKVNELRAIANNIVERIQPFFLKNGWTVDWSAGGTIDQITKRWSEADLRTALRRDAEVDLAATRSIWKQRAEDLRQALASRPTDRESRTASSTASQRVIELKEKRHALSQSLGDARHQRAEAEGLEESLKHRIAAARDVLRLKMTGVGRVEHFECPTCHQGISPSAFALRDQSRESVEQHIEALVRDHRLMRQNVIATVDSQVKIAAALQQADEELSQAERDLAMMNVTVGLHEQMTKVALDLNDAERRLDRLDQTIIELNGLQSEVNQWVEGARTVQGLDAGALSSASRDLLVSELRTYLLALGHNGIDAATAPSLRLEESVPYLGQRRLSTLGSASDLPRLVAAYSLALASTARKIGGYHPGFVLLDEPLQQNPDTKHRKLFLDFLTQELARSDQFQTIIFTFLDEAEQRFLVERNVELARVEGPFLLEPMVGDSPAEAIAVPLTDSSDETTPDQEDGHRSVEEEGTKK